jgi:hypothetical protein
VLKSSKCSWSLCLIFGRPCSLRPTTYMVFCRVFIVQAYQTSQCRPIYTVFTVQAYRTSQYVVPHGGIFLVQYTRCSLCRLIGLLRTWCRTAAFFSSNIHGVHCAGLSDFSVRGAARRNFSRQVAQLFRRKFRR